MTRGLPSHDATVGTVRLRQWGRETIGVLLLVPACGAADTVAAEELDGVFVLTAAEPSMTFETTYCLEDALWQSVAVSATFSVVVDDTVRLRLIGAGGVEAGGSGGDEEPVTFDDEVEVANGLGTISLQRLEDWAAGSRRCAVAAVEVSAAGLAGTDEVHLEQPRVRVSGISYARACEEPATDADSFSVDLTRREPQ